MPEAGVSGLFRAGNNRFAPLQKRVPVEHDDPAAGCAANFISAPVRVTVQVSPPQGWGLFCANDIADSDNLCQTITSRKDRKRT